jgi:hypothetical protein
LAVLLFLSWFPACKEFRVAREILLLGKEEILDCAFGGQVASNYAIKVTAVKILVSSFASGASAPYFGC